MSPSRFRAARARPTAPEAAFAARSASRGRGRQVGGRGGISLGLCWGLAAARLQSVEVEASRKQQR